MPESFNYSPLILAIVLSLFVISAIFISSQTANQIRKTYDIDFNHYKKCYIYSGVLEEDNAFLLADAYSRLTNQTGIQEDRAICFHK